ncbi:MAG TPA: WYL domain-containing protein, partial [Actinomycetota bacterium]|nr:WYL domain-containing protein [Actinomycetota bacterium]
VRLPVVDEDGFVSWVIGFGEDAIVRSPDRMRKAVVGRLEAISEAKRPRRRAPSGPSGSGKATKPAGAASRAAAADSRRSLGRLERILLLVPFCVSNPGVSIEELSRRFSTSRKELVEDLELLFLCGLPEYTPADLIEVSVDEDHVSIRMADYFAKPLRITRTEAIPLYVRAHALVEMLQIGRNGSEGLQELAPLKSALDKLAAALLPQDGGVADLAERIKVHLESSEARWLPLLREAVTQRRTVAIEYYSYSRDVLSTRRVDPYLVFSSYGHWYTSGWCHDVSGRRMFRLDRVKSLEVTQDTFEPPDEADAQLPPPLLYVPGPEDERVTLRVPESAGVSLGEYLPVESSTQLRGGRRELSFRTSAFPWLEKLLLRLGPDVEIVEPAALAASVKEAARRILSLYERKKR